MQKMGKLHARTHTHTHTRKTFLGNSNNGGKLKFIILSNVPLPLPYVASPVTVTNISGSVEKRCSFIRLTLVE